MCSSKKLMLAYKRHHGHMTYCIIAIQVFYQLINAQVVNSELEQCVTNT